MLNCVELNALEKSKILAKYFYYVNFEKISKLSFRKITKDLLVLKDMQ